MSKRNRCCACRVDPGQTYFDHRREERRLCGPCRRIWNSCHMVAADEAWKIFVKEIRLRRQEPKNESDL